MRSSYRQPSLGEGFVSGIAVDRVLSQTTYLRRSLSALFHTAFPIQPPPLRGTSFHRKEGVSTRAPSLGRGCRAQRGGVGFLFGRRSRLLFAFPIGERGPRSGARVLVYRLLETISPLFHTARTLSGSLRSPPSPRGEGFVSGIPLPHPTSAPSGHLLP